MALRFLSALALLCLTAVPVRAADPLDTVRAFCLADGRGNRLAAYTWTEIAPLVTWRLEPAWDRVLLIHGYRVGTPTIRERGVDVEVSYEVTALVRPFAVDRHGFIDKRTLHLVQDEATGVWRLLAPPPPPHVFDNQADARALSRLLEPESAEYLSSSIFVWSMLHSAGWGFAYLDTHNLPQAVGMKEVSKPRPGDLVLYYDGGEPYHVGLLEAPDRVVSSTLNGGLRRAPVDAFAGDVHYQRPLPEGEGGRLQGEGG
jgi:hypothetical protein